MTFRVGTFSSYTRFLLGMRENQYRSFEAQQQLATGLRIHKPSDDPVGTSRVLSLSNRLAELGRHEGAVSAGRLSLDSAAGFLQRGSGLISDSRALVLQAMNGTLNSGDRRSIATEIELLRSQMLEVANSQVDGRYLFGGTRSDKPPWVEVSEGGQTRVVYRGNEDQQVVRAGEGVDVPVNLPGQDIFGRFDPSGTSFAGLTGVASGTTADEGSGYERLILRHDGTDAPTIGTVGLALVAGGAQDTLLGDQTLTIDATNGTVQLGDGPLRTLPVAGSEAETVFVVTNELGAELHLDLSGYGGGDYTGTVTGQGSASLDGTTFTTLTFTETDLELRDEATGTVLHLDTTAVGRAGEELVTFSGTVNLFDLLQNVADDLREGDGLDPTDLLARLESHLNELDRNQDDLLVGLGTLGARSQRLAVSGDRAQDLQLHVEGLVSSHRDADLSEVALDLARSDLILQVAQASGARLLQTTLLNFLG